MRKAISTVFSQQILDGRLLLAFTDGKKVALLFFTLLLVRTMNKFVKRKPHKS